MYMHLSYCILYFVKSSFISINTRFDNYYLAKINSVLLNIYMYNYCYRGKT